MISAHGLTHRWFPNGEGWAVSDRLPAELRDALVACVSRWLDSPGPLPREWTLGPYTLFFRVYPETACLDPLARDRHPFVACAVWARLGSAVRDEAFHRQLDRWFDLACRVDRAGPTPALAWGDLRANPFDIAEARAFLDSLDGDDDDGNAARDTAAARRGGLRLRILLWGLAAIGAVALAGRWNRSTPMSRKPSTATERTTAGTASVSEPAIAGTTTAPEWREGMPSVTAPSPEEDVGIDASREMANLPVTASDAIPSDSLRPDDATSATDSAGNAKPPAGGPLRAREAPTVAPELLREAEAMRRLLAVNDAAPTEELSALSPGALHVRFFDELARRYAAYYARYRPSGAAYRPVARAEYAGLAQPGGLTSERVRAVRRRFAACLSTGEDVADLFRAAKDFLPAAPTTRR